MVVGNARVNLKDKKKPTTFKAIKAMFSDQRHLLEEFEQKVIQDIEYRTDFKAGDNWFVDLLCWNKLERNLQLVNPMKQVETLLKQLGWTCITSNKVHKYEGIKMSRPPL